MRLTVTDVLDLLQTQGQACPATAGVSQLDHALQCAYLAEIAGEQTETVVACLLHDLGRLLMAREPNHERPGAHADEVHPHIVQPFLQGLFPEAVLEPIRLHVQAKRYLCLIEPSYQDRLSPAARDRLQRQGGAFTEAQAEHYIAQPFAIEATRLRRYDDLAKVPGKRMPGLTHFAPCLELVRL